MGERSIQRFQEALKDGEKKVHSIHVMVVGSIGTGKSTLIKRLIGGEVNMSERHTTEAIDVHCCDVSLSTGAWKRQTKGFHWETIENACLTIWDIPGQCAFYASHQALLTRRAIFLLVFDVNYYRDMPGKVHELVDIWLNSIHSCTSSQDVIPSVILVATHVDKLSQDKRHEICKRYFGEIRSYLEDKPIRFHLIDEDFTIDNTVVDSSMEDLRRKIVEVASQQPYWGEEIPTRWLPLQEELMRQKANGVKVISHDDVMKINKKGAVQLKPEELDLFLSFLHETGVIIYGRIEKSKGNIVLDPTWMNVALNSLINIQSDLTNLFTDIDTRSSSLADCVIADKLPDFKDKGILSSDLIDAVWTAEKYPDLHAHKEQILENMEELNIIARPRAFSEIGETSMNYFLTPSMLRQESPREITSPEKDPLIVSTPTLCLFFKGNFLPLSIFHKLIAACVARWPISKRKETSENLIFSGCSIFDLGLFHRLTLHCENHVVFARIMKLVADEVKIPDSRLCSRVRKFITMNLTKIIANHAQNLQYELCSWWSPTQVLSEDGRAAPFEMWFVDEGHDSDSPISPEHMNLARLNVALVTVCADALREILLSHAPASHKNIYQAILANKAILTMRTKNSQGQWQNALLLPDQSQVVFIGKSGQYVATVDNFDISLLYVIIRNVSAVSASLTDWGSDPTESPKRDKSLGASVDRIRIYRNKINHSQDGKISKKEFDAYWEKIKSVLDDIEKALGRGEYKAKLEEQRRQVISVYEAC